MALPISDRALSAARVLLRTPSGRQNPTQLAPRLFSSHAQADAALREAEAHGLARALRGVWDGTWWELTAKGHQVAAWTMVRASLPRDERARIDALLGLSALLGHLDGGPVPNSGQSETSGMGEGTGTGTGIATGTPPGGGSGSSS